MDKTIFKNIEQNMGCISSLADLVPQIANMARHIIASIKSGGTLYVCGNGGSAADAQHFAAELVGRFELNRKGIPAVALTTDTSIMSAIANDFGYDTIFERQVDALLKLNDVLVGISTSGNSENVLKAVLSANNIGAYTIGLLGRDGGKIVSSAKMSVIVPSDRTCRIQEGHIFIIHTVCEIVERCLA